MRFQDLVKFAWKAMADRKLRTALTIIGIVIGPATIVALLGATQGFSNAVTSEFASTGSTSIFVTPVGRGSTLTASDVSTFEGMGGVQAAVPFYLNQGTITQGSVTSAVQVLSMDFSEINQVLPGLKLASGANPGDNDLGGANIGYSIAYPNAVGATNTTVGQLVTVTFAGFGGVSGSAASGSRTFAVRGVYAQFGQGFLINPDSTIFVALSTGQAILHTNDYSGIVVVATSANTVNQVSTEISDQFGTAVRVITVSSILSTIQSVTSGIGTILGGIGGISVLVAFIGIMTTMFTTVVERTKEIGVLKAIGYSSGNILSVFLVEALVTGFVGGVIGAGTGVGLAYLIVIVFANGFSFGGGGGGGGGLGGFGGTVVGGAGRGAAAATRTATPSTVSGLHIVPAISPELVLLAIGLATAVGALAGFLPSWRASRLTPVEALRKE
ncbi:MAG: ABC transporter permease [Nitrososphaerota archaeon]|nr:ABC transporter permease [Nitrososphaerota archaeon]